MIEEESSIIIWLVTFIGIEVDDTIEQNLRGKDKDDTWISYLS